jgi:hypothetical protein
MLFTYFKSYKKGVFSSSYQCPQTQEEIEKYLQLFLPLYIYTNDIRAVEANISQVVPSILLIIYGNLDRMVINDINQNYFKNNLIYFLKSKFDYELSSPVYLVAALLNVNRLNDWRTRSFGKEYFQKSIDSLLDVLLFFDARVEISNPNQSDDEISEESNEAIRLDGVANLSRLCKSMSFDIDCEKSDKIKQFKNEINLFKTLIFLSKIESSCKVWSENRGQMPCIYNLALRLLSIPATSAYIERFFNVTGIINSKSNNSMSSDHLIARSMLKVD